jgi:TPR repeat protein
VTSLRRSLHLGPLLALSLSACQGLDDFARSVDEVAAKIVPTSDGSAVTDNEADRSYRLGLKYMDGDGVVQSDTKATEQFRLAADRGVADAQFMLGLLHQTGRGVAKDSAAAFQWFRRAAEQGHVEAQFFVGMAFMRGRGVRQDDREAIAWLTRAATANHTGAQYELGVSYATARGVARDDRAAIDWFEKAAALGHPEAQYFAAQSYSNGWGTAVDHAWAARWYGKAADQGVAKAQSMLGVAYASGLGLPRDRIAALTWLTLAAAQKDEEAIRLRDALSRKMSRAEIDQANGHARRWRATAATALADPPTVRFTQIALAELGFSPGSADGQMGQRTRTALAAYQAKVGMKGDGSITFQVIERLRADRLSNPSVAKSSP